MRKQEVDKVSPRRGFGRLRPTAVAHHRQLSGRLL